MQAVRRRLRRRLGSPQGSLDRTYVCVCVCVLCVFIYLRMYAIRYEEDYRGRYEEYDYINFFILGLLKVAKRVYFDI